VRVGFVIDTLQPGSGTENQLLLLLDRFDPARVVPAVCCLWDNPALAGLDLPCPVEVLGFHRLVSPSGLRGLLRLRRWIRREALDLVVTFFRDSNLVGTLGGRLTGIPVLASRRNLGADYWHTPWELMKLRVLNRLPRAFVSNSEAVARYTAEAEGVDPARIEVLPNAIDLERFRPPGPGEREAMRKELGIHREAPLVVCVANLRPVKSHELLLEAFARIEAPSSGGMPPVLLLVGEGSERKRLESLCDELGIAGRVRFLGRRADGERVVRGADVGVLASKAESLSNALMECLASGIPAVATDVGGNGELVIEGKTGRLVPPGDAPALAEALRGLLAGREERLRLGREARRYAEARFSVPAVLDRYACFERYAAPGKGKNVR